MKLYSGVENLEELAAKNREETSMNTIVIYATKKGSSELYAKTLRKITSIRFLSRNRFLQKSRQRQMKFIISAVSMLEK